MKGSIEAPARGRSNRLRNAGGRTDTFGEQFRFRASMTPFSSLTERNQDPLQPLNSFRVRSQGFPDVRRYELR